MDRVTQLEQLRLQLMHSTMPAKSYTMHVADGRRIKKHTLRFIAEEVLDTPLGPTNTVHYERVYRDASRKSDFWLAPEWGYLMVKTVHIEDAAPIELRLKTAKMAGQTLAANSP